MNIATH